MSTITAPAPAATSAFNRWALTGVAFAALFIGSLILSGVLGTTTYPSPFESDAVTEAYFADNQNAVLGMGILQTLSALPLIGFVLAMNWGARTRLARTAGMLAAASLAITGLLSIAMAAMDVTGDRQHLLHDLTFLAGGPIHVPLLGILVGAGTAAFAKSAPRWTTILGSISAGLSVLSIISFAIEPAAILLPLGRFTAILWIVISAVRTARRN